MTDRHAGYLVTLADDIREDDAEAVVTALRMINGVIAVEPVLGGISPEIMVAQQRADIEWRERLLKVLRDAR